MVSLRAYCVEGILLVQKNCQVLFIINSTLDVWIDSDEVKERFTKDAQMGNKILSQEGNIWTGSGNILRDITDNEVNLKKGPIVGLCWIGMWR